MMNFLVVFDDILQSREPAVMVKPAFRAAPESRERRRDNEMLTYPQRSAFVKEINNTLLFC